MTTAFEAVSKHDLTDGDILDFWHSVRESGRAHRFFWDEDAKTDEGFRDFVRRADVDFWLVRYFGITMAACWLTGRRGRMACIHFCVLPVGGVRRVGGVPIQIRAGEFMLGELLGKKTRTGRHALDVLVGMTPKNNRPALKYAEALGGRFVGYMPGGAWFKDENINIDLVLTEYTRKEA